MSCFNEMTCISNELYHNINCNYTLLHYVHTCNSTITCKRLDGLYDCCTDNIIYCTIEYADLNLLPTRMPTAAPIFTNTCEYTCNLSPDSNNCYWY